MDREWRQIETELERYFPARPRSEDVGTRRPAVAASAEGSRSRSVPSTPARDKRTRKGKPFPSTLSRPSISKSGTDPAARSSLPSVQHAAAPPARLAYYAIKTLMRLRQVSQCRAILDLALATELLTDARYRRLLREIGEGKPEPPPTKRPSWDAKTGTLRFENTMLRTFTSQTRAKNQVAILEAFERHNWSPRVANPLNRGQQVHDAVQGLNRGLKKIVFHVEDDGRQISWARG